ncbi:MAG: ABC transporter ATP-binding protein/permease [Solirubrobacteraceae bacterium]|nr:ABC transporter ATP-binding protein/permease [Solirubrobacteraceae bacterium]
MRRFLHRFLRPAEHASLVEQAPPVAALQIVRRFWPFARPYRAAIAFGLVLLVLVPAVEVVEIWLFKLVVDDVLVPQDLGALVPIAAAYLGLALLTAVLSFSDDYVATWVGERFLIDVRARIHAHLQTLSPSQLARRPSGDLLSRITSDVQAIERLILSALGEGVSAIARILFFGVALVVLSWKLALVALVVAPLFYLVSTRFARLIRHAAREKRRRSGSLATVAEESLATTAVVQSLNREDEETRRFVGEARAIMDAELAASRIQGTFGPLVGLIELLGAMAVIAAGVWALTTGDLTLGGLLVFLTYLSQLYRPLRSLGQLSNDVFAAAAGAERVLELLDERPEIVDRPGARPLPLPVRGRIDLDDVRLRHPGADRDALAGVSLTVHPGETVAITGPSGAGKSSLASLLVRFADPTSGTVRIDGHDVRDVTRAGVRDAVGLLLQDTVLPDVTASDAIGQGRPDATPDEIAAAARAAGVHDVLAALPDGYATRLGRGGSRLSGGERRRVVIARALLRDSPVLVLDEPTTGLDAATRDALLPPLRRLTEGRTTIVVTHDPEVMAWADRVIVLRDGRLVEDRRTAERVAGEPGAGADAPAEDAPRRPVPRRVRSGEHAPDRAAPVLGAPVATGGRS